MEVPLRSDYNYKAAALKSKLHSVKRCTICTLKLPCKHFPDASAAPPVAIPSEPSFQVTEFSRNMNIDTEELKTTVVSPAHDLHKVYKIFYKKKITTYPFGITKKSNYSPPPLSQRLKLIQRLERFKEEKLKREREKIEQMERDQHEKDKLEAKKLAKWKRHASKVKNKAKRMREQLDIRHKQLSKSLMSYDSILQKRDKARSSYLEQQNRKLSEFRDSIKEIFVGLNLNESQGEF